jgi:uncharacterized membrane protein YfcA
LSASDIALLSGLIFAAAILYTSVGHAGASGYLAAMALFGLAPAVMKPTALTLNILVASFAVIRLQQAGLVNWRPLVPLVAGSIPAAFIGGSIQLPGAWYRVLVGLVLLAASAKFFFDPRDTSAADDLPRAVQSIPAGPALLTGGLIGILSGLTGTGGGIFLSPLLLLFGWAGARQQAGITAPFILVNSIAGLAGNLVSLQSLPADLPYFVIAALLGAVLGTQLGIRWFSARALQRALGVVLVIAAGKFLLT